MLRWQRMAYDPPMEIREQAQAEALREVAQIGAERAELLAKAAALLPSLEQASIAAVRVGAARSRVRELAEVSTTLFYGWLRAAGIDVRRGPGR